MKEKKQERIKRNCYSCQFLNPRQAEEGDKSVCGAREDSSQNVLTEEFKEQEHDCCFLDVGLVMRLDDDFKKCKDKLEIRELYLKKYVNCRGCESPCKKDRSV